MILKRLIACLCGLFLLAHTAAAATLLPPGEITFLDNNGLPLSGGQVYFYIPNTSTPKDTYKNAAQSSLNTNPVILDSSGRAIIYGAGTYREVLQDSNGNTIWDQATADTSANNFSWAGTSGGTANAQAVTAPNFTNGDGQIIGFIAGFSNSSATTISVNTGTPINVLKGTSSGPVSLSGGEIIAGNQYQVTYNATAGNFQLSSYPISPGFGASTNIASATTTDLGTISSHVANVTGTTTINSFGSTAATSNPIYVVTFAGALTLTNNNTSLILPSAANITTAANDSLTAEYLGSGNWQVLSYSRASGVAVSVSATASPAVNKLKIINGTSAPTTTTQITASSAILGNSSGNTVLASNVSVLLSTATSGAGGLDTGSIANSTWYYVWLIENSSGTVSGIYSLSSTAPTLPSGYIYDVRIGAVRANGSAQLLQVLQLGQVAQYVVLGSGTITALPVMATGSASLWTAIATGTFVPPTSARIRGTLYAGAGSNDVAAAPNSNYSAYTDAPVSATFTGLAQGEASIPFDMVLESTNIYWEASQSFGKVKAVGWVDAVPAN